MVASESSSFHQTQKTTDTLAGGWLHPGKDLVAADVINHCKQVLSKYKVPKRVHFIEQIPVTPYGKPDKKALRNSV